MGEELDQEIIESLKKSRELLGEIDEVIVTPNGEVIDGKHRLKAYPGWKTKTIQADRKTAILYRLHRNFRRKVSAKEVKALLTELAIILEQEGTPRELIAREIVKLSPYSESYTLSCLPKKYKQPKAIKAAESTYKVLYTEPKKPEKPEKEKKQPKILTCPVCGAALILIGDLLVLYKR